MNNKEFENELASRIEREFDNIYSRYELGDELEPIMVDAVKLLESVMKYDLLPGVTANRLYNRLKNDLISAIKWDAMIKAEQELDEISERIW